LGEKLAQREAELKAGKQLKLKIIQEAKS